MNAVGAERAISRAQWLPHVAATVQAIEGTSNNTTASYVGASGLDIPRIGGTPVTSGEGNWRPSTSTLAAVGLTQEIFDFGRIAAQAGVADAAYEAEGHSARTDARRVDLLVRDAFYGFRVPTPWFTPRRGPGHARRHIGTWRRRRSRQVSSLPSSLLARKPTWLGSTWVTSPLQARS